jgi:hypothetical protein
VYGSLRIFFINSLLLLVSISEKDCVPSFVSKKKKNVFPTLITIHNNETRLEDGGDDADSNNVRRFRELEN